jgi:dethiobiotin synthetase
LNHSLLTRGAIEASGAHFAGWIGNFLSSDFQRPQENLAALERLLGAPLAVLGFDPAPSSQLA